MAGDLTANFSRFEFICPCCGVYGMAADTIGLLQQLRTRYGARIDIVKGGGYRCSDYEKSATSAHRDGRAADLDIPREDLYAVIRLSLLVGFTGIGVKNHGGRYQLHIDNAKSLPTRPRPWVWSYP